MFGKRPILLRKYVLAKHKDKEGRPISADKPISNQELSVLERGFQGSVAEMDRLFDTAAGRPSHNAKKTVSINRALPSPLSWRHLWPRWTALSMYAINVDHSITFVLIV